MNAKVISLEHKCDTVNGAKYLMTTVQNGIKNQYEIEAKLCGLQDANPYLVAYNVEALTNNYETLMDYAVEGLFEEYIG